MSICLFYLNSFEVLLSDFNKKDTLYSWGLSSASSEGISKHVSCYDWCSSHC